MTHVVSDACIKCRACVSVCPVDAYREGEKMMVIDPDVCIDCGVCVPDCPTSAISSDSDADPKWTAYNAEKSKGWPVAQP